MSGDGQGIMDPQPGQRYVEFMKDSYGAKKSEDGGLDSGLDVTTKSGYGNRIYISKVDGIAVQAGPQVAVGDRIVALNGKKIESYGSLEDIRSEFYKKNTIAMVTDPTMLPGK